MVWESGSVVWECWSVGVRGWKCGSRGAHSRKGEYNVTWSSACYLQLCNYENINAQFLVIYIFINAHGHL